MGGGVVAGVFKSTDGGSTWSEMNTGLTSQAVYTLAIDPTTPTTLYAGTFWGVFKYEAQSTNDSSIAVSGGGGGGGGS
jgi:hypothetical protein